MSDKYVLDTSAIFTFLEGEEGAEQVEQILANAGATRYLSFITYTEVYYISYQEQGSAVAEERLESLNRFPIIRIESDPDTSRLAGYFKAHHKLSLADAWIAALAKSKQAILVHKDPEFESVANEIQMVTLPYKNKTH